MHRCMELPGNYRLADLRDEGTALAAMRQQLAGLVDIARCFELDDLDRDAGNGGRQPARDLFRLRQRHCALARADPELRHLGPLLFHRASSRIMSDAFSAIMMVGALVLPDIRSGITDASTTRRPSMPRTRRRWSTTASGSLPMRQVEVG